MGFYGQIIQEFKQFFATFKGDNNDTEVKPSAHGDTLTLKGSDSLLIEGNNAKDDKSFTFKLQISEFVIPTTLEENEGAEE